MPEGAIYVGRPSYWGNPWKVGERYEQGTAHFAVLTTLRPQLRGLSAVHIASVEEVVALYFEWLVNDPPRWLSVRELAGHDLVCWCPLDAPCHADVLLELANAS